MKLKIVQNDMNRAMARMNDQLVRHARDVLSKSCLLELPRIVIEPYLWFNPVVTSNRVLSKWLDDFVMLKQDHALFDAGPPPQKLD